MVGVNNYIKAFMLHSLIDQRGLHIKGLQIKVYWGGLCFVSMDCSSTPFALAMRSLNCPVMWGVYHLAINGMRSCDDYGEIDASQMVSNIPRFSNSYLSVVNDKIIAATDLHSLLL